MAFRLTSDDLDMLASIADHRILPIRHVRILHQRNLAALRRRLRIMADQGLIRVATQGYRPSAGRPESLVSLLNSGVDLLKKRRLLDADVPAEHVTADRLGCLEHHLLLNEFRVQMAHVNRIVPTLTVRFLSSMSPKLYQTSAGRSAIHERFRPKDDSGEWIEFTPDGVFAIRHAEAGKTVLLFLEVDMGTETVASPQPFCPDIRQKIVNYKAYFQLCGYKRYEQTWNCRLNGFRLLFLTHNTARLATLARLVREMRPSEFIWLTDQQSLMSQGVWAPIWAPAGLTDTALKSILGSQTPNPTPTPADLV